MFVNKSFSWLSVSAFFAIAVSSGLGSCSSSADPDSVAFDFDTIQYRMNETVPAIAGQAKPCLDIDIAIQSVAGGASDELVGLANGFIAGCLANYGAKSDSLAQAVSSLAETHELQYKSFVNEGLENYKGDMAAAECWLSGSFSIQGTPVYNRDGILTYAINVYEYNGGPHGTTSTRYSTRMFCKFEEDEQWSCVPISLPELFCIDSQEQVNAMFEQRMAACFGVESAEVLRKQGPLFESAEIVPTDNFCFDAQQVTFLYNVYELAPYSVGPIVISFSWQELLPYIPADSPLLTIAQSAVAQ